MAKTTENSKTLREQLASKVDAFGENKYEIDALGIIVDELAELVDRYASKYDSILVQAVEVGKKPDQKVNKDGEPIFFDKNRSWNTGTKEKLMEEGIAEEDLMPYYDSIYEDKHLTLEQLDSYDKPRALAYKKLAEFLADVDFKKV